MARHTKVYNALVLFYTDSVDEIIAQLKLAHGKRFSEPTHYDELRASYPNEVIGIVELAKDQGLHFWRKSDMMQEWEALSIAEVVAEYANKATNKLRGDGVVGKSYSINGLWEAA